MPATFTQDVFGSTREKDPQELQRMKNLLRQQAETANKQFGVVGAGPQDVRPSFASDVATDKQYAKGEFERRANAAPQAYELGKTIDARTTGLGNLQQQAMWSRDQAAKDVGQQQYQQGKAASLSAQELQQQFQQSVAKLGYQGAESEAARMDLISNTYWQGGAEMKLLDLANQNQLRMADIEKYYAIMMNDLNNQLRDMEMDFATKWQIFSTNIQNQASNMNGLISGLSGVAGAGAKAYFGSK